jgi:hypothetical protein
MLIEDTILNQLASIETLETYISPTTSASLPRNFKLTVQDFARETSADYLSPLLLLEIEGLPEMDNLTHL